MNTRKTSLNIRKLLDGAIGKLPSSTGYNKEKEKQAAPFQLPEHLADETLLQIYSYCDAKTLYALGRANRRFNGIFCSVNVARIKKGHQFFLNYLANDQKLSLHGIEEVKTHLEMIYTYLNVNLTAHMNTGRKQARLAHVLVMLTEIMEYLTTQKIIQFGWEDNIYSSHGVSDYRYRVGLVVAGTFFKPNDVNMLRELVDNLFHHMVNGTVERLTDTDYDNFANTIDPSILLAFSMLPWHQMKGFAVSLAAQRKEWSEEADPEMISIVQNLAMQLQNSVLTASPFPKEETNPMENFKTIKKSLFAMVNLSADNDKRLALARQKELTKIIDLLHKCTVAILNRCVIREDLFGPYTIRDVLEKRVYADDKIDQRVAECDGVEALPLLLSNLNRL